MMFMTVLISVIVTLYVLFCFGLYGFYYLIEVVFDLPISGQSPCTAHAALKRLIEKLLQDAVSLPQLQQEQQQPPAQIEDRNRTYENLLATAIINKVISSCQSNLPTSSGNSESSRLSTSSHPRENKEYFFGEETLDSKWKTTDLDTTSVSSLEEWMQSECSTGSKKYVDRVTLMIKQDIEEVDQSDSEPEDMDVDYLTPNTTLVNDSDTNNWFLQKRHFQSTHSPVPVPMLVPNPTTEAKVFIGDKPVDDTSDLSDVGSDYEEPEPVPKTHTLLIKSKTLIGGLNAEHSENGDEYSESSTDSGVKEVNEKEEGRRFELMNGSPQLRADITVDDDNLEDSSFLSVYSNTEKEAEYTERYSSLPRTILKTPTPPLRPSRKIDNKLGSRSPVEAEKDNLLNRTSPESEFGGIYSKKEKEKWKYAVEMKNNPYSKENIEKRLRMSSSSVSSLFGSDYYARQAKSPSGGKVKSPEINSVNNTTQDNPFDYPDLHHAVQAYAIPYEVDHQANNNFLPESTSEAVDSCVSVNSDSDLSYVNFYDVEHSQVFRKSRNEDIQIPIKPTSVPGSFKKIVDENQNLEYEQDKHDIFLSPVEERLEPVLKDMPIAKPRVLPGEEKEAKHRFTKAPVPGQRHLVSTVNPHVLRRHLSESDLLQDSFDKPPTVLHHRRDNTLISRIYKDPRVRHFALSTREELPVSNAEVKPTFSSQWSLDSKMAAFALSDTNHTKSFYNSDDGLAASEQDSSGKTGRMSFFSSEEDLLSSLNSDSKPVDTIKNDVEKRPSSRDSYRSSSPIFHTPKPLSTKKFIYSSSEDLLSPEEVEALPQRKDNTLISKIYKDPNVRRVALNSRDYVPDDHSKTQNRKYSQCSSEDEIFIEKKNVTKFIQVADKKTYNSLENLKANELENQTENKESVPVVERKHQEDSEELKEVAKKKLVHSILGKIGEKPQDHIHKPIYIDEDEEIKVSVKSLRKMFEKNDVKGKQVVSSLTARSLSKQIKESLKQ